MTSHPNTIAGLIAAGAAWAATAILARYGIHLNKNQSHALDLGTVGLVLFVGRAGIKNAALNVWRSVWNGSQKPEPPPPDPTA